jgi:hypothetical protein
VNTKAALFVLTAAFAVAAPPVVGTIMVKGSLRLDGATIRGNATLFEGETVETQGTGSTMDTLSGTRVILEPQSKGRVFRDRLMLEKGTVEVSSMPEFHVEVIGLRIQHKSGRASARMALKGTGRVQVAALEGAAQVSDTQGLLIATLPQGKALDFELPPSPESHSAWKMTGCLSAAKGHFLLTDELTNVTAELKGSQLAGIAGRVEIAGAMDPTETPASGASQVLRVSQVRRLGKGCPAAATAARSPGKAGGVSATTVATIGGVAVAAVVGGLAATGYLPGQGSNSLSR